MPPYRGAAGTRRCLVAFLRSAVLLLLLLVAAPITEVSARWSRVLESGSKVTKADHCWRSVGSGRPECSYRCPKNACAKSHVK